MTKNHTPAKPKTPSATLKTSTDFVSLDVGCGNEKTALGEVNVDFFREGQNVQMKTQMKGASVDPHKISNFVVADASYLPFKDDAFNVVFSSHVIEHCQDPFAMYKELCRVSKRKIIIRCPHRRGSGAKRPFHVSFLDEKWFKEAADKMGFESYQFLRGYDYPITSGIPILFKHLNSLPVRLLRGAERRYIVNRAKIPFEIESWTIKNQKSASNDPVDFVVVYNDKATLSKCFLESKFANNVTLNLFDNQNGTSLPVIFNEIIQSKTHMIEKENLRDRWVVFCHQDLIFFEDLQNILAGKETNSVYGVIGAQLMSVLFGQIKQTDGSPTGLPLENPTPVLTLDEMCIIVHSSLLRQGLRFDERFNFHFYGADLCMQAYASGFDVKAVQVNCQHKSKTLTGDLTSADYKAALKLFSEKWQAYLPIRTTTKCIEPNRNVVKET
jgi:SAM-dependent methyltransferase